VLGSVAREAVSDSVANAAAAIEEYFGGPPDRTFPNDAGDLVMMNSDKKIRFDINNHSHHKGPHFHIERLNDEGDWIDAGSLHTYDFLKE
jgi:hypothetical protein